jgi:quercetin dioxygenase-like cupin family protein
MGNPMALEVRRVVTGHDEAGKAIVEIDEIVNNIIARRPGAETAVVWATSSYPPDLDCDQDISADVIPSIVPNGVVCRISRFAPGIAPRMHRTSSLDYVIALAGEIVMEMDNERIHLKAGDVLVQRGTVHNWVNEGTEPCTIAFINIDSNLPTRNGERLIPHG